MGNGALKDGQKISRRGGFETRPYKGAGMFKRNGQASLEASVALVAIIILLAGIIRIWFWANNQIVERQISFNAGRVFAGTSSDGYSLKAHWPLDYTPPALDEERD